MLYQPQEDSVLNLFSLKGQVALVTGGSRGIGLAAAIGFAEAGADVAIVYNTLSAEHIKEVGAKFEKLGVKFKAYKCNVVNRKDIFDCVDEVVKDFGKLTIVVPNAGIAIHQPAEDFTEEDYRKTMAVNIDGAFYTAQAAANCFKAQQSKGLLKQGKIIFTVSISSQIVNFPQKQAPYNAAKAGLTRLCKCLAVEWVDFCRVNAVSPGYIDTDMLDVHSEEVRKTWMDMIVGKRHCKIYELKGVYVFLASDASSYVVGEELVVGGGYTLT